MRKYLIPCVATLVVLAVAWVVFGQPEGEQQRAQRGQAFAQVREMQLKGIAVIQEQVAKLKSLLEETVKGMEAGRSFQDLSEEERTKMRETFTKRREEQQKIIGVIELELARLKGSRQLQREQEEGTKELQVIRELAGKEQAKETLKGIDELIAKRQKAFEDKLAKLGLQLFQRPGSSGQ